MAWDFCTEPEFQQKLDWMDAFVRERVEPLDVAFPDPAAPYDRRDPTLRALTQPMKEEVKRQGLWACHLGPELGGPGYGQVKLALMNEILGRSQWAPTIFGCQAPDSGNAEILAAYGTEAQKRRYLEPLLAGDIVSCFAMTEPQGGSDPRGFRCRAFRDGDHWVLSGEKYFASHADLAEFLIVMAITNPDVPVHRGASMFLVPRDTPGLNIVRRIGLGTETLGAGHHCLIHFEDCRVPADHLLGPEGEGFAIAQTRLGGGRIHHAMRTVAMAKKALQMMCERALSRQVQGEPLASKQLVQQMIADSFVQLEQFRLLVLYAAWHIDQGHREQARLYIAAAKIQMAEVLHDVIRRAVQLHGALGCSNELPLMRWWVAVPVMGIADGPTEVHKLTVARQVLKQHKPYPGPWPPEFLPTQLEAARQHLGLPSRARSSRSETKA
ncbi:MAG: acyl-CoA dehydrogenase family protein [Candidatus Binatia bacterium]|nr:acyl-CoA dehydrogenase family protein [Candidatus Binatia bacterium]